MTVSPSPANLALVTAIPDPDADIGLVSLVDPAFRPPAGAIVQDSYDIDCPWHRHDMHQIQYAFEGSIMLEDAYGRHLLPRGLAGWIPAGVSHRDSIRRVRSISILLDRPLVPEAGERVRILRVSPLMREMMAEAARWPLHMDIPDETGTAFFAAFARLCGEWITGEAPLSLPAASDPVVIAAAAHVRADVARVTLGGTCRAVGISERALRRRFQADLGIGWEAYRRRARVMAGAAMLADGDRPVGCIAASVGFESQSAFARAFRLLTGETPRMFRTRAAPR